MLLGNFEDFQIENISIRVHQGMDRMWVLNVCLSFHKCLLHVAVEIALMTWPTDLYSVYGFYAIHTQKYRKRNFSNSNFSNSAILSHFGNSVYCGYLSL